MKQGDAICAEARAGAVLLGPAYQGVGSKEGNWIAHDGRD